jgi:two-component system chemotaxis sensor kinase CheA
MDETEAAIADSVREAFAEESVELLREIEGALQRLAGGGDDASAPATWLEMLRWLHTLKGAASVAGVAAIKEETHALEERVRSLYTSSAPFSAALGDELFAAIDVLRKLATDAPLLEQEAAATRAREASSEAPVRTDTLVRTQEPAKPPSDAPLAPRSAATAAATTTARGFGTDLLRIKPQRVDTLHALVGELTVNRLQLDALSARILEVHTLAGETEALMHHHLGLVRAVRAKLPAATFQSLLMSTHALIGATRAISESAASVAREAPMIKAQTASAIASVEDGVRELRIMPIEPFFEGLVKVARDAARSCEKEVEVQVRAEGAEIDRAVLMRLRDPFLHLVRNAVVHGIEPAGIRRAAGKKPAGTVLLEARCTGSRAVLRVADDGAGIDVEAVLRKAVLLGLLDSRRAIDDEELLDILAHPGFSTRDKADTLAGRGVGLDVVAGTVHDLDGQLHLDNLPGAGAIFTVDVPIRARAGAGLIVQANDQLFGLLLHHIDRVVRLSDEQITRLEGRPTALIDGDPLSVVTLAGLLGMDASSAEPDRRRPAVVLRFGRQRIAVIVDDIPGEQSLVIKPLSDAFAAARFLLGGALQPDGSLVPVLQVSALFELATAARTDALPSLRPPSSKRAKTARILVVDDSITMRSLIRNILHAAGYAVTVAHDGVSALEELGRGEACDLVITDLQMPRMDGFELCRAIRGSASPHTPIIVVTSVAQHEEKKRALDAGADACIVKGDFEQVRFLELVQHLVASADA